MQRGRGRALTRRWSSPTSPCSSPLRPRPGRSPGTSGTPRAGSPRHPTRRSPSSRRPPSGWWRPGSAVGLLAGLLARRSRASRRPAARGSPGRAAPRAAAAGRRLARRRARAGPGRRLGGGPSAARRAGPRSAAGLAATPSAAAVGPGARLAPSAGSGAPSPAHPSPAPPVAPERASDPAAPAPRRHVRAARPVVTATPTRPPTARPGHASGTGDSLWQTRRRRLGAAAPTAAASPHYWQRIYAANRAVIGDDPDRYPPRPAAASCRPDRRGAAVTAALAETATDARPATETGDLAPAPVRPPLRVVVRPAPRREPPFDDELAARPAATVHDQWLPFDTPPRRVAPVAAAAAPGRPARPGASGDAGCSSALIESAAGRRPLNQLGALLSFAVTRGLATEFERAAASRRPALAARAPPSSASAPASRPPAWPSCARCSTPAPGCARSRCGCEDRGGRWVCTRIQLG